MDKSSDEAIKEYRDNFRKDLDEMKQNIEYLMKISKEKKIFGARLKSLEEIYEREDVDFPDPECVRTPLIKHYINILHRETGRSVDDIYKEMDAAPHILKIEESYKKLMYK